MPSCPAMATTSAMSFAEVAISVDICLISSDSAAYCPSVASTVLRTDVNALSYEMDALIAAAPNVRMGVVRTVDNVFPAASMVLETFSHFLPKASISLPAAVHADLAVASCLLVLSISPRVSARAALARLSAASASMTASVA